jgi:uncharacterized protein (DUF488 family)
MTITLHTVGHSDRSLDELLELLRSAGIRTVVDVRQQSEVSHDPHFSQDGMREALTAAGIDYHCAGRQLGGLRQARPASPHRALADVGLRGYADYMGTDTFKKAAAQLIHLGGLAATAILCIERDPMVCQRSLLADYLVMQGVVVMHLFDTVPGQVDTVPGQAHLLRPEVRRESAELIYDRVVSATPL